MRMHAYADVSCSKGVEPAITHTQTGIYHWATTLTLRLTLCVWARVQLLIASDAAALSWVTYTRPNSLRTFGTKCVADLPC